MWARAHFSSLPGALARAAALVSAGGLFYASGCGLRVADSPTQPIPCFHAMDCPPSQDPCIVSTCFEQQCVMVAAAQNTVVRDQKPGDCRMRVCDGNGHAMEIGDDVDVPADDGNECTAAACKDGAGVHEPVEVGEACDEGGVCNGKGTCGVCLPGAERCEGNAVATCSEEGAWQDAACPEGRPICKGKACVGIRHIAAGGAHTCALFEDGSARCFGASGVRRGAHGAPPVAGVLGAVELALGGAHACARRADGTALCWGHNGFGQVGDGTTEGPRAPTPVLGLAGATAIAAGTAHSCAIVDGGKVVCWGRGDRGQLGVTTKPAAKPAAIEVPPPLPASPGGPPSPVAGLFGATKIALGGRHACALGPGGQVACWGEDESGELGNFRPPEPPAKPKPGPRPTPRLVSVKGIEGAIAIALGATFGCALLEDGQARCWGDNAAGQLGDGTTEARAESVVVKGVTGATAISLGAEHGCVLREGGGVTCWGKNDRGQLGDGTTEARVSPVSVPGLAGARALSAGGAHTCVMLEGGAVRCWGGKWRRRGRRRHDDRSIRPHVRRLVTIWAVVPYPGRRARIYCPGSEVSDMKLFWGCLSLLTIGLAVGCSATGGGNEFENAGGSGGDGGSGAGNNQGGAGGGFIPGSGGAGGGAPGDNCSDAAKLIYVLSDANELYSFNPPAKQFTKIGTLGCNTSMMPNSMAVDRDAVAWVNYVESDPFFGDDTNGVIYKVSTKDASCGPAPVVQLISNWFRVGMGFSTNDGAAGETLYVTGTGQIGAGTSPGLGKINPVSFGLETLANFSPSTFTGQSAELTGTGDGRLYGYFTTSPVQVGQIDKATGAVTKPAAITGLETPSAWAFSFWGGSFYLYAAGLGNSNVTKYDPATGAVDNAYMTNIGFRIVGAGVSTCAPLEPPK